MVLEDTYSTSGQMHCMKNHLRQDKMEDKLVPLSLQLHHLWPHVQQLSVAWRTFINIYVSGFQRPGVCPLTLQTKHTKTQRDRETERERTAIISLTQQENSLEMLPELLHLEEVTQRSCSYYRAAARWRSKPRADDLPPPHAPNI